MTPPPHLIPAVLASQAVSRDKGGPVRTRLGKPRQGALGGTGHEGVKPRRTPAQASPGGRGGGMKPEVVGLRPASSVAQAAADAAARAGGRRLGRRPGAPGPSAPGGSQEQARGPQEGEGFMPR